MSRSSHSSEIAIVGAGVMGLMTAIRLADSGHKVTVIEAEHRIGLSQSGKWTGVIHHPGRKYTNQFPPLGLFKAQRFFAATFPDAQISSDGWEVGSADQIKHRYDSFVRAGRSVPEPWAPHYATVERDRVASLFPRLAGSIGFVKPEPVFDPLMVLRNLTARALALGVEIHTGASVRRINLPGGRAQSVSLADGQRVKADSIILAAGPGLNRLLDRDGLRSPLVDSLRVRRMIISLIDWPGVVDDAGQRILLTGLDQSPRHKAFSIVPAAERHARAGTPNESVGGLMLLAQGRQEFEASARVDHSAARSLAELATVFPEVAKLRPVIYRVARTDKPLTALDPDPTPIPFIEDHGNGVITVGPGKAAHAPHLSATVALSLDPSIEPDLPAPAITAHDVSLAGALVANSFHDFDDALSLP